MPGRIEKRGQNTCRLIVPAGYDPAQAKNSRLKTQSTIPPA